MLGWLVPCAWSSAPCMASAARPTSKSCFVPQRQPTACQVREQIHHTFERTPPTPQNHNFNPIHTQAHTQTRMRAHTHAPCRCPPAASSPPRPPPPPRPPRPAARARRAPAGPPHAWRPAPGCRRRRRRCRQSPGWPRPGLGGARG